MGKMIDIEKKFSKLLKETEIPISIFSSTLPETIEDLQKSILGKLGTDTYVTRTHAIKIPAILIHVFNIPSIDHPIIDHAGLTVENGELAFRYNLKLGFLEPVGNGVYKVTKQCVEFSKEHPIPENLTKIIEFLSKLSPRTLSWLTERLVSVRRTYNEGWIIQFIKKGDFKDPYNPSLPRETILYNIYRFLIRKRITAGPPAPITTNLHVQDLDSILQKDFQEAGRLNNLDLIDLKSYVSNRFVYIEAINIASTIYNGSVPLAHLSYFVYDWLQYEEFTKKEKGEPTDIILVKYLKNETRKDIKKLLKSGLIQKVNTGNKEKIFLMPYARCYTDLNDNHYYLWDQNVVKRRFEQIKNRWKKLQQLRWK